MNVNKMPNPSLVIILMTMITTTALAQEESNFPGHLFGIYQPNDRALDFKIDIEKRMGVYLTHPPRRHKLERVDFSDAVATINVWQTVKGYSDDELKCRAIEWLYFGRTKYVEGGRGVLGAYKTLKALRLQFFEIVKTKNSRRLKNNSEIVRRYLRLRMNVKTMLTLEPSSVRDALKRKECNELFKKNFRGRLLKNSVRRLRRYK